MTQQEHVRGQRTVYGKDAEVANEQPDVARVHMFIPVLAVLLGIIA